MLFEEGSDLSELVIGLGLKCNLPAPQYRGGTLDVCLLNGTHCRVLSVFSLYAKGDLTIVLLWS